MIETFLFERLGEGEGCWNVIWKLQLCCEVVGGGDVDSRHEARLHIFKQRSGKFISPILNEFRSVI